MTDDHSETNEISSEGNNVPYSITRPLLEEEKRLWEDLRHGLFLGSKSFVERIRKKYLPEEPESGIPQQTQLSKRFDPISILGTAEQTLKCDVKHFVQAGRLSGAEKDKRNFLIYLLWKACGMRNEQIGQLFGLSYSAVSHAVKSLKVRMRDNQKLEAKFNQLYSQFKL